MLAGKQNFFIVILKLSCFFFPTSLFSQFAPAPPDINSTAVYKDDISISFWANDVKLNRSWQNIADTILGKTTVGNETSALGPANNLFVSLGDNGSAIVTFPFTIYNESGFDFAIFENGFAQNNDSLNFYFMELALVEVSENGTDYIPFYSISNLDTITPIGSFGTSDCSKVNNLAGKYPLNYGTPFDIDELGLDSIVSIKIIDAVGSLDSLYSVYDSEGNKINDPFPTPFPSSGFDLNAVAALNQKNTTTNIFNISSDNRISISPNPIQIGQKLNIHVKDKKLNHLSLISSNGQSIFKKSFTNTCQLSTNNLSSGIYFIKISQQNSVFSYKFIVE